MSLSLRPMTGHQMANWLADQNREYIASRVESGESAEAAQANAAASMARMFPDGTPADGHAVFVLVENETEARPADADEPEPADERAPEPADGTEPAAETEPEPAAETEPADGTEPEPADGTETANRGVAVGSLWVGPYPDDRAGGLWVWSVAVDAEQRGRGLGRAAMVLVEDEARCRGATEIGLNVFGFNHVAVGLYRSLEYETTSMQMRKLL